MYPHKQLDRPCEIAAQSEALPSNKNTHHSKHPLNVRELLGYLQHALGGGTIIGLTIVTILLWFLFRPPGQPTSRYLGEILGTTAIALFSCSLIVATKAPFLERLFGGLDRMYVWHRWSAIAGVVLLFPHYVLVISVKNTIKSTLGNALGLLALYGLVFLILWALVPRLPVVGRRIRTTYQRWFTLHRLTGLFVIAGLIHGFLVDPVLQHSPVLLGWYIAVAAIGTVAYLYRELLNPFFRLIWQHNYTVETINRLNQKTVEVILTPVAQSVRFVAGQFVFVRFEGEHEWERHPFTVSSAPQESFLRLSIKGLGDYTQSLIDTLQPGGLARVGLAFGMFDYRNGGHRQVWIAGGIGITPFRSWIRTFSTKPPFEFDIDFYYTVRNEDEALFLDEIATAAEHYPTFRSHITYSEREGLLTMEQIAASCNGPLSEKDVYLCGPSRMIENFQRALRKLGVPSHHIHFEHFDFR
jgi:Predicted ferric reductase